MNAPSEPPKIREDTVLTLQLPYRECLALHRTVFAGGPGPRIAIVSGLHGDELEGLYVTHRLAAWLEDLLAREAPPLRGTVEIYPAVNPLGIDTLTRGVPPTGTDLNRSFPGRADGVVPQRIADALMRALAGADLVIDVHASNIFLREIPQVRINHQFTDTLLPLAATMNLDVVWVHGSLTVLEATLAHSLNERGVPCLVAEMGVGMRVTPAFAEQILVGILHTCRALGVLAPDFDLPPLTHQPLRADDGNVHYLNAETSGLFVPEIEHWSRVRAGQLLGRIVSPHRGGTAAEVLSPVDGVLFTLREYPLVYEGSLMARIAAAEIPEAAS
jgi:predicted deacylase